MSSDHNPWQLLSILLTACLVVLTTLVITSSLAHQYGFHEPIPGLLHQDLQDTTQNKPIPISPAPWIHCGWAVVFLWQIALAFHAFFSIFRRWTGVPVYTFPVLLSSSLLVCVSLSCLFINGWFIAYDRQLPSTACLMAVLAAMFAWAAFGISLHSLEVNILRLKKAERDSEIWIHRIIVHNGLALLGQWCVFVSVFNIATAMAHNDRNKIDQDLSSAVALAVVGSFMVVYFISDITCLDYYTRYTMTPYFVSILVLSACLYRQDDWLSDDLNFLLLSGLLAIAFISLMVKSACVACRVMRGGTCGSYDVAQCSKTYQNDDGRYLIK